MYIPHKIQYYRLQVDFLSAICIFVVLLTEIKAIKVTFHSLFKDNSINPLPLAQIILILTWLPSEQHRAKYRIWISYNNPYLNTD
jgi:hypothetical protein